MALIKCKDCGNEISNKAANCPHCGNVINKNAIVQGSDEYDGLAIAGFICSLSSILLNAFVLIPGILSIVFLAISLFRLKYTKKRGKILAISGLIIAVIFFIIWIFFFSVFRTLYGFDPSGGW